MKYYTAVKKDQHILFVALEKVLQERAKRQDTELCAKAITFCEEKKKNILSCKNRSLNFHAFSQEKRGGAGEAGEPWNKLVLSHSPPLNKK